MSSPPPQPRPPLWGFCSPPLSNTPSPTQQISVSPSRTQLPNSSPPPETLPQALPIQKKLTLSWPIPSFASPQHYYVWGIPPFKQFY